MHVEVYCDNNIQITIFRRILSNKSKHNLEFNDSFDQGDTDTTKWFPYYLSHWSLRDSTQPNYTFYDHHLNLQITETQVAWCSEFDGEIRAPVMQTGEYAGALGSKVGELQFSDTLVVREEQTNVQLYTPQYGYFETRAKG